MRFILYSCFCVCIVACSSTKEITEVQTEEVVEGIETKELSNDTVQSLKGKNVKITMSTHIPYCGGAAPTEDRLNYFEPYTETVHLIDLSDSSKIKCTPNAEGILYLELPNGNYAIQEVYKDVSFAEFMKKNMFRAESGKPDNEACYIRWWKSYLITFEVSDEKPNVELSAVREKKCFVGIDPCAVYQGAMPP